MYKGLDLSTSSLQPSLFHLLSPTYLIPIYAMPLQSLNWIHNQFISLGGMILHYNVGHCDLQPFFWWIAPSLQMYLTHGLLKRLHSRPVNWEGQRIPPDELSVHKGTHFFQLPGCLCSRQIHRHRESECVINGIFCQIIWVNGCFGARGMPVPTSASLFFLPLALLTRSVTVPLEQLWNNTSVVAWHYPVQHKWFQHFCLDMYSFYFCTLHNSCEYRGCQCDGAAAPSGSLGKSWHHC